MRWNEEDWLIIDSVLNSVAKSLRRIERKERKETAGVLLRDNSHQSNDSVQTPMKRATLEVCVALD